MKPNFVIAGNEAGITKLSVGGKKKEVVPGQKDETVHARRWQVAAEKELHAYFAGQLRSFSIPCDLGALPSFTRAVLRITARIPYGEVRSYRWVAKRLGKPKATRAVGNALARNPIPIIIPCHRVVRSDGTLGGYALGLGWKRRLLELEKARGFAGATGSGV